MPLITHLYRLQEGSRCRQSTGQSACRPGSSSTWARSQRWLSSCVYIRLLSRRTHEAWHRSPSAARLHWPPTAGTSEGDTWGMCTWRDGAFQIKPTFLAVFTGLYLKPKLVEEVVDEVFDEADDANVQMLPCDVMEDDPGGGRRQFVPQPEVLLMAVDGHLECQESQHQEVVLQREYF